MSGGESCPSCGEPLDKHDHHLRFTLPDPVVATPNREHTKGTWMSHADPRTSDMMQVPYVGAFVRALLPVRLTSGHKVTFGVWLAVDPAELQHFFAVWWEPEYADLVLHGWLANALPVWGLLGTPVRAAVHDPEQAPYCDDSPDDDLAAVLTGEWPHDLVLSALGRS